ncbi:MAG: MBL fold metallo-hydrolase [Candidatus Izemoplasma sp.]|nr:MBL fold metallo-hydrolase [Candidatus Izemoplasma sp.]
MKLTVLASGSKGNATYLETASAKLLIDVGISHRQIKKRMADQGLIIDELDAILITHEHTDHIKGLTVTLKRHPIPVYVTEKTYQHMYFKTKDNIDARLMQFITTYETFIIKGVSITPFRVSHDAEDTVGYVFEEAGKKLVYATDIGYLPKADLPLLKNADAYIFESNYDVTLLFTSNRPFYLKQRIDSVKGHMSNTDSAYNMTQLIGSNTRHIILAHPSRECNTKELALKTYTEVFTDYGIDMTRYNVVVAHQDIPTDIIEL